MRHLLWLGPLVVVVAVIAYWTTIRPELAVSPLASTPIPPPPCCAMPPATSPREEVMEPILVLREVEAAPAPEPVLVPDLALPLRQAFDFKVPRPEAGRGTRPWMPYAAEDVDLSAQRKLQWARLIVDEGKTMPWAGGDEETSEPPLFEQKK